jgi:malate synthase
MGFNMASYVQQSGLGIDHRLFDFLDQQLAPAAQISTSQFVAALATLVEKFASRNRALLQVRQDLQERIDQWHREREGKRFNAAEYKDFLTQIEYLVAEGADFEIATSNVDPEIAVIAGPQLVVPVSNARYALNAANARWGSLYDALYGTDAMGSLPSPGGYDPVRGAEVVAWGDVLLDEVVPFEAGTHANIRQFQVVDAQLKITIGSGEVVGFKHPDQFMGYLGDPADPTDLWLRHNNLGIHIVLDRTTAVGKTCPAGVSDIILESAITTIIDFEDSVAAVDAEDKVAGYTNWLGLIRGDLTEEVTKNGKTFIRAMQPDLVIHAPDGAELVLPGRSLMLVRNVGHLMTTPAVLDAEGNEIPEGILDALVTVAIGKIDVDNRSLLSNSRTGSIYVVKPKMHGPEEIQLTVDLFSSVEDLLGLPRNTVKIGIMDEERRTSVNLKECIRVAKDRVAFINTGFLDRTGDEMHTSMQAGAMVPKGDMKKLPWIRSYEERNVDIGIACGFRGKAQIGKGMWAMPDRMQGMLTEKINHPLAGANVAWVPSPTAATLHATHYHRVNVQQVQEDIAQGGARGTLDELLTIPIADPSVLNPVQVQAELDNNIQGILGYVVRWVQLGVGASKVPDIHDVGLMEDRATCRISSQHVANWLLHGVVSLAQVDETLQRMAAIVDRQNASEPGYQPMAPEFNQPAYLAARALIVDGLAQPSGYTEPLLHHFRQVVKAG